MNQQKKQRMVRALERREKDILLYDQTLKQIRKSGKTDLAEYYDTKLTKAKSDVANLKRKLGREFI